MAPTIGQWSPGGQAFVTALEQDGGTVLKAYVVAQVPALGVPIISYFTGLVCNAAAKFIIENIDDAIFAGYVAIKTGKQVSDYIGAVDSGNNEEIDKRADDLIKFGRI